MKLSANIKRHPSRLYYNSKLTSEYALSRNIIDFSRGKLIEIK